ncbi:hypothetical protein [Sulfuricella sp. T08]|uniref:hypothetical protein n=1 Tax=Sulfuricella sp. T08 TaxID=1632857 RepID=UPI0007508D2E|nr:hypothetical protein [Sulfuricella sp. T08]
MRPRVAFYPCCHLDILEPLALLAPYVDEVIFCDINAALLSRWRKSIASLSGPPSASFLIGDVRQVISSVKEIDILFYRGDSPGEDGSGVFVLGDSFLPFILERFHADGGLIITDGSNSRGSNFERMIRPNGLAKHGWLFRKCSDQPFVEKHRLHVIDVKSARSAQPIKNQ